MDLANLFLSHLSPVIHILTVEKCGFYPTESEAPKQVIIWQVDKGFMLGNDEQMMYAR